MHEHLLLLRRYTGSAWRNRWYGVIIAWLVCAGGWIGVTMMPNVYQSSARLYVDADAVLTPLLKGLALDNTVAGQLEVMQRTLLSRPNLDQVISKTPLGLTIKSPADREALVSSLGTSIKLVSQARNLFTITYRNANPQLAFDVVQAIMNIFIESRSGASRADMENAQSFLQQQISIYEQQLRTSETARAEFRAKYVDLLPSETGVSRLDAARGNVTMLTGQLTDAMAKRSMLQTELTNTPTTVVVETDPAVPASSSGGGGALAAAQQKLQELLVTETNNHPDVEHQRQVIEMLKTQGGGGGGAVTVPGRAARTRSQPNTVYTQLKVSLLDTDATIASLQRQVGDATKERDRLETIARNAPGIQAQYINLDRDYDTLRKNYGELLARRESMRLSAAADADADKVKLRIVDPAQVSQIPVSPPRTLLTLGVLAVGLGAGVVVAIGLAQLDRSFRAVDDLHTLGFPVLGGISLVPGLQSGRGRVAGSVALATAVLLLCGVCGGLIYHTLLLGMA